MNIQDTNGKMRPFSDILLDLADRFSNMDPARANFFGRALGLDQGTINLLLQGRKAVEGMLAQQKKYAPTDADVKAAQDMQKSLALLELSSSRLGITLLTELTPAIKGLVDLLTKLGDWLQAHPHVLTAIAVGLGAIGTVITVGLGAAALGVAIDGLTTLTGVLSGLSIAALAGSGGVIAALAAITYAGYELITHWGQIKKYWRDIWTDMQRYTGIGSKAKTFVGALLGWRRVGSPTAGGGVPAAGKSLLNTIASSESNGSYNELYGGGTFSSYADHPNQPQLITSGPNAGRYSTAAGRYQMLYGTWMEAKKALGLKDFSPASQDKAAWWLAQRDYKRETGRDLLADLNSGDKRLLAGVGSALSKTWTSLPQGIEATQTSTGFVASMTGIGARASVSHSSRSSSRSVHIDSVVVNTQATDAAGIARDLHAALENQNFATQADYGAS